MASTPSTSPLAPLPPTTPGAPLPASTLGTPLPATTPTVSAPTKTVPTGEQPLTPKQQHYLATGSSLMIIEKKILLKGTTKDEEREFLNHKMNTERKPMCGQYETLAEMATDIDGRKPSKDIEKIIFRNMMKIMLNEFDS